MKENQTTYAILGLLTTECRTGYEIKQLSQLITQKKICTLFF